MIIDTNCYDQDTLHKVYRVLKAIGMSYENQTTIVSELQKEGILFRERLPDDVKATTPPERVRELMKQHSDLRGLAEYHH